MKLLQEEIKKIEAELLEVKNEIQKCEEEQQKLNDQILDHQHEQEKYVTVMKENQQKIKYYNSEVKLNLFLFSINFSISLTLVTNNIICYIRLQIIECQLVNMATAYNIN